MENEFREIEVKVHKDICECSARYMEAEHSYICPSCGHTIPKVEIKHLKGKELSI